MYKNKSQLIITFGKASSLLAEKASVSAKKFCFDFNEYNFSYEDDHWWDGELFFENLKKTKLKNLMRNKKTIILVAPCLNSSQIGFINILIKSFKNKKFVLIINKNKIIDSLYNYFSNYCEVVDVFYTAEFQEKIYNDNYQIKPNTSILEMEGCLNLSFIKRIKEQFN
jgi:hypothetical protein